MNGYNNFKSVYQQAKDKMIKLNSFSVEPQSMLTLRFSSQEDLNKSLTFSARSTKEHSISQTNCSHLSASKIVTDSEQDQEQEQFDQSQICQRFHFEGSCPDGSNCKLSHNGMKVESSGLSKSLLLQNFPQLVTMGIQRARSFLE